MKRFTLCFILAGSMWHLTSAQKPLDPRIVEVYGSRASELQVQNPGWVSSMEKLLNERISYVQSPQTGDEKYRKLSEFALLNHDNPDLKRDQGFDPATFNPLKYDLNFFSKGTMVYRIDGTSFLLVIEPQN